MANLMRKNESEIIRVVMADAIVYNLTQGYEKAWDINGETMTLAVEKI